VGQQIDLAWEARGRLEERFFGGWIEQREVRARESQTMGQIAGDSSRVSAAMWWRTTMRWASASSTAIVRRRRSPYSGPS